MSLYFARPLRVFFGVTFSGLLHMKCLIRYVIKGPIVARLSDASLKGLSLGVRVIDATVILKILLCF